MRAPINNILRRYIDLAQAHPGVPKLTSIQIKALDTFETLAESDELCYSFCLEPGDILFMNNFTTLHRRDGFIDHEDINQKRLLLRLWLSVTNSRPLPESYLPIYHDIRPGALRGGYLLDPKN